jgi:hypothetical protein
MRSFEFLLSSVIRNYLSRAINRMMQPYAALMSTNCNSDGAKTFSRSQSLIGISARVHLALLKANQILLSAWFKMTRMVRVAL